MELENYTLSSPGLSALGYLGDNRIPGALPQADMTERLWRSSSTTKFRRQSMNQARLHHINCDLGNLVLTQLGPHFMFQTRRVHSSWEVQEKYHASFVLVK